MELSKRMHCLKQWYSNVACIQYTWKMKVKSSSTLCGPVDYSPPGSSVHGIVQARVLEWVSISFSRVSSRLRDGNGSPPLQADALPTEPPGKPITPGGLVKKNPGSSLQNFLFFSLCVEAKNSHFLKLPR